MLKFKEFFKLNWNDIIKPVVVLLSICIVIPLALSVTNAVTKDRIIQLEKQKAQETMKSLIEADKFEELEFDGESKIKYNN